MDLQFWHVVTYEVMSTCPAGIDGRKDTSEAEAELEQIMPALEGTSGNGEMRASGIVVRVTRQTVTYEPPPVMRRPDFGPGFG